MKPRPDQTGSTEEKLAFEAWDNQIEEAKRASAARNKALGFETSDSTDHFKENKDLIVEQIDKDKLKRPIAIRFKCASCEEDIIKDHYQRLHDEDGWSYTMCEDCIRGMRLHYGMRPVRL